MAHVHFLPPGRLVKVCPPPRKTSNKRRASNKRLPPIAAGSKARLKFIAPREVLQYISDCGLYRTTFQYI